MNTKRAGRETLSSTHHDRPWTASRCMRMLRPISNEIACLKTAKYGTAKGPAAQPKNPRKRRADDSDEKAAKPTRNKPADPDWAPEFEDKRPVKRQYTGRPPGRPNKGKSLKPGELSATPLIARHSSIMGKVPYESPQTNQDNPLSRGLNIAPSLKFLRHLDANATNGAPTDVLKHVNRLFDSFKQLLVDTASPLAENQAEGGEGCVWTEDLDNPKGSRSLLAMCLRKVPVYMDGRQAWEDENNVKCDASQQVYEELEELGTNGGWKKLRHVVRAHATSLLVQAIEADLLVETQIHCLIRLCDANEAKDSSRELLSAFAHSRGPLPPPFGSSAQLFQYESATYPGISALFSWAEKEHDWPFFYREIGNMIRAKLLPFEWLATKTCKPVWTRIIRAASDTTNRSHFEAKELLRIVLLASCGIDPADGEGPSLIHAKNSYNVVHFMKKAFNTTISSLCTILSSIVLVSNREYGSEPEDASAVHCTLEGIAAELVSNVFSDDFLGTLSRGIGAADRIATILTTVLVISVCGKELESPLVQLHHSTIIAALHTINKSAPSALESLPELVCSIVKSCGKINREDGFLQLKEIVVFLLGTGGRKTSWFMERLALDSADEFAHTFESGKQDRRYSRDREAYFAFLREVETVVDSRQHGMSLVPTPHRRALRDTSSESLLQSEDRSGYRWESGLSEWVAFTPKGRRPQPGQATCVPPIQRAVTRLAWDQIKSNPTLDGPLSHQSAEAEADADEGNLDVGLSSPICTQQEPLKLQDETSNSMAPPSMPALGKSSAGPRPNHVSPIVLIPSRRPESASQQRPPPKFKLTSSGMRLRKRQSPGERTHSYTHTLRRSTRASKKVDRSSFLGTFDGTVELEDSSSNDSQIWSSDVEVSRRVSSSSSSSSSSSQSSSLLSSEDSRLVDEDGDVSMTESDSDGDISEKPLDDTDELSFLHAKPARRHYSPMVVIPAPRSRHSKRSRRASSSFSSRQETAPAAQHNTKATAKKSTRSSRHSKTRARDSEDHDLGSEDELSFL
ncbi:hypothetical protein HDK64DRAFT_72394 [Phyllosticta capitalensis]